MFINIFSQICLSLDYNIFLRVIQEKKKQLYKVFTLLVSEILTIRTKEMQIHTYILHVNSSHEDKRIKFVKLSSLETKMNRTRSGIKSNWAWMTETSNLFYCFKSIADSKIIRELAIIRYQ